jgi:hypothetical protein
MAVSEDPEGRVAALLLETERAHGAYEQEVLAGARDDDWPAWYAAYLLDHGLPQILPAAADLEIEDLARLLERYDAAYRREQPAWPWPAAYAQQLVAAFG